MVWADALSQSLNVPHEQRKDRIRYFVRLPQKRMRKIAPLILRSLDAQQEKDSVFISAKSQQYLDRHAPSLRALWRQTAPIYSTVTRCVWRHNNKIHDYEYDATI